METKLKSMFVAALTLAASTQKLGINLIRVSVSYTHLRAHET